jgi:hypothetical protein
MKTKDEVLDMKLILLIIILLTGILISSCSTMEYVTVTPELIKPFTLTQTVVVSDTPTRSSTPTMTATSTVLTPSPSMTPTPSPTTRSLDILVVEPAETAETDQSLETPPPNYGKGVMSWFRRVSYNFIKNTPYGFDWKILDIKDSDEVNGTSPSWAGFLGYSHFSDLFAYWIDDEYGQFWISDLLYLEPKLVYTDEQTKSYFNQYGDFDREALTFFWLPDDKNLVLDFANEAYHDLLYTIGNNSITEWNYHCDRLAISPASGRIATWCPSNASSEEFAVFEWGGKVWYSKAAPENELVRLGPDGLPQWGWTADGVRVAFFDPLDETGSLFIANAEGQIDLTLPGMAYWLLDYYNTKWDLPSSIGWAKDGSRILVYAKGQQNHPCFLFYNIYLGEDNQEVPCWQVLDSETGEIIWSLGDLAEQLDELDLDFEAYLYRQAVISPDGSLIAFAADMSGLHGTIIVDVDKNEIISTWNYESHFLRWNDTP